MLVPVSSHTFAPHEEDCLRECGEHPFSCGGLFSASANGTLIIYKCKCVRANPLRGGLIQEECPRLAPRCHGASLKMTSGDAHVAPVT